MIPSWIPISIATIALLIFTFKSLYQADQLQGKSFTYIFALSMKSPEHLLKMTGVVRKKSARQTGFKRKTLGFHTESRSSHGRYNYWTTARKNSILPSSLISLIVERPHKNALKNETDFLDRFSGAMARKHFATAFRVTLTQRCWLVCPSWYPTRIKKLSCRQLEKHFMFFSFDEKIPSLP